MILRDPSVRVAQTDVRCGSRPNSLTRERVPPWGWHVCARGLGCARPGISIRCDASDYHTTPECVRLLLPHHYSRAGSAVSYVVSRSCEEEANHSVGRTFSGLAAEQQLLRVWLALAAFSIWIGRLRMWCRSLCACKTRSEKLSLNTPSHSPTTSPA